MALSATAKRALLGDKSADGLLMFVTIVTTGETLRFVNNPKNVTGPGSNVFTGYPFQMNLASDTDESPTIEIRIGNIDRDVMNSIEALTSPPVFTLQLALISTPTVVEKTYTLFKLREVQADALWISGMLAQDRISTEIWPKQRATRVRCPSLFRRTD